MGCISSKLLAKPGNFSETVSQSFQRRSNNVLQELISSSESNNDQQFLALLCSKNTATSIKPNGSEPTQLSKDPNPAPSPDPTKVETINSWELLAGLEEENEEKETDNHEVKNAEQNVEGVINGKARSFRTVEDLDVILTSSDSEDSNNFVIEDSSGSSDKSNSSNSSGAKRKTRARELAALELPAFEFGKSGSLRDWLLKGGQVFSPGSYVTPKFGSSVQKEEIVNNNSKDEELVGGGCVFDPEMLAQFEDAIEEMRREEESILNGIVERLAGNEEQERPIMSIGKKFIELNCQGNNGFIGGVLV
ncbi:hypothetical protein FCM35_KLT05115 [Carex littledalei]|uniref:Uncharacterized protein n=1 Tax=Carex littledalei TaxID=544730 RepID=A0A833QU33_9POAL|nr:hypothetical protein FCM35_KLT05115 [Carex littledalei]